IKLLHLLSKELLEREILDSEEIDKIIKGEELPPVSKVDPEADKKVPDHVQKLMEQHKQKDTAPQDEPN
ncbi:MAG: hypothetical protein HKM87_05135, partial [Ignavibacteriaceae bacterium]|nr:hypothetical protein [Ignavibacteriaceae bacterium]